MITEIKAGADGKFSIVDTNINVLDKTALQRVKAELENQIAAGDKLMAQNRSNLEQINAALANSHGRPDKVEAPLVTPTETIIETPAIAPASG